MARAKRKTPVTVSLLLAGGVFVVLLALFFCYYTSRRRREQHQQSPTLSSLSPDALGITNGSLLPAV